VVFSGGMATDEMRRGFCDEGSLLKLSPPWSFIVAYHCLGLASRYACQMECWKSHYPFNRKVPAVLGTANNGVSGLAAWLRDISLARLVKCGRTIADNLLGSLTEKGTPIDYHAIKMGD